MAEVTIPYTARGAFVRFHQRTERDAVLVCHRRAGKTVCLVVELILRALSNKRKYPPPQYAFFYPTWKRAKDIAWPYLKHYTKCLPGVIVREGDLSVELWDGGPKITLYGAANSRGVGIYLDGVVYDEVDEIPQMVISEVSPALSDHQGWSVYAGMLKGRYNLWKRYEKALEAPNHYTLLLRASESRILPKDELVYQRNVMGEAAFEMQYECNANAAIANAIYGKQMDDMRKEGRIGRQAIDPTVPLDFFFDIGHSMKGDDWTMWAVQLVGRDILFQAYYARTGEIPAHYAAKVQEIADKAGVHVGTVFLPHDGNVQDRNGRTCKDDLEEAGVKRIKIVSRTPNLWDSINDLRALLPRVYINAEGCSESWMLGEVEMPSGIDCLDFYTKKVDATTGLIMEVPVHNQYSHGADAARTFSEAYSKRMLEGTSTFADGNRQQLNVSRDRVTPDSRVRRPIRVTR